MTDDNHINNLSITGKWLLERSRELISKNVSLKNKKNKRISRKTVHEWRELYARMDQFKRDMNKALNEGEEWKLGSDNT